MSETIEQPIPPTAEEGAYNTLPIWNKYSPKKLKLVQTACKLINQAELPIIVNAGHTVNNPAAAVVTARYKMEEDNKKGVRFSLVAQDGNPVPEQFLEWKNEETGKTTWEEPNYDGRYDLLWQVKTAGKEALDEVLRQNPNEIHEAQQKAQQAMEETIQKLKAKKDKGELEKEAENLRKKSTPDSEE